MKKKYISPETTFVNIGTTQVIAMSTQLDVSGRYDGEKTIESRQRGIWDNDDDMGW